MATKDATKDIEKFQSEAGEFVDIEELETGGIVVRDGEGNEWTVAGDSTEDYNYGKLPLELPRQLPGFHVEFCRPNQVADWMQKGFVPVTRKEMGVKELPADIARDYGTLDTSTYRVGDAVAMKIPKILADRRYAAKARAAKEIRDSAGPTDAMIASAKAHGVYGASGRTSSQGSIPGVEEDVTVTRTRVDEPLPMR